MSTAARMSVEELADAFSSSEQDIHVNKRGEAFYCGKRIADHDGNNNADFAAIKAWCDAGQYWPNVWETNDHGNVELFTLEGVSLGGLV